MVSITLKVVNMIINPTQGSYLEAFHDLLRRKYLGENVDHLLYDLDYLFHLAANLHYYSAIYGRRRVLVEIFSRLGKLPHAHRLEILADIYRTDRTVQDDLFTELVNFKKQLIRESAPFELVQMVNAIIASLARPDEVYRNVRHLLAMYDVWKELGEDAVEYFRASMPGAPGESSVTDTELAKIVTYVLEVTQRGERVSSVDIKRYVGDPRVGNKLLNEAKKRGLIDYNGSVRSFVVTQKGLEFIGKAGIVDPDEIVRNLKLRM